MFYEKVKKQLELGNVTVGLSSDKENKKVWVEAKGYTALFVPFLSNFEKSNLAKLVKESAEVEKDCTLANEAVTVANLKVPIIWDGGLSDAELGDIQFELYLNGQKGNHLLNGHDFLNWLSMYDVNPSSVNACQIEIGVPTDVPEGTVRFVRQDG
ncbi:MAG: hypothetical protein HRU38_23450 [Saccharospirillaceae bacterium]|nr:hypothetical protein [Saccharospirillaceae bacterium]